ncbi:hypothetical protein FB451DRAFT_1416688 [Mycena latifolia]|nr:hypothetical protein FB451DRAFT_1416688 [Mycena latifolia]
MRTLQNLNEGMRSPINNDTWQLSTPHFAPHCPQKGQHITPWTAPVLSPLPSLSLTPRHGNLQSGHAETLNAKMIPTVSVSRRRRGTKRSPASPTRSDLDDDTRWDDLPFFQPDNDPPALCATASTSSQSDATPSPAESAPSPAASALSPSTTVTSPTASTQSPLNSLSRTARSLSPPPSLTEVLPTEDIWLAAGPDCHDENPHWPSPLHDAGNNEAATQYAGFQGNNPLWNLPVIPDHIALDNVDDATKAAIEENPGNYLAATVFCGGSTLSNRYTNLRPDTQKTMEEVTGEGIVRVIKPQAKTTSKAPRRGGGKPDKFAPPTALIVRCSDAEARMALAWQATFGRDRALAFHITPFSATCLSWAVGFFRTDIDDPPALTGRRLAFAVYDGIKNGIQGTPKALALIDHAMQGGSSSSLDQRLLSFARTFEVRHLAHDDNPIYVLFAKPCTMDHKLWDAVRAAMRTVTYIDEIEAFTPHTNTSSGHNICADCKLDCHPKYLCMFTVRDKNWWGPHDLVGTLRDIRGGRRNPLRRPPWMRVARWLPRRRPGLRIDGWGTKLGHLPAVEGKWPMPALWGELTQLLEQPIYHKMGIANPAQASMILLKRRIKPWGRIKSTWTVLREY